MNIEFKIEAIIQQKPIAIFARLMREQEFSLSDNPTFGGCPIKPYLSQPRVIKKDGSPDFSVYAFLLENGNDKVNFKVGEIKVLK